MDCCGILEECTASIFRVRVWLKWVLKWLRVGLVISQSPLVSSPSICLRPNICLAVKFMCWEPSLMRDWICPSWDVWVCQLYIFTYLSNWEEEVCIGSLDGILASHMCGMEKKGEGLHLSQWVLSVKIMALFRASSERCAGGWMWVINISTHSCDWSGFPQKFVYNQCIFRHCITSTSTWTSCLPEDGDSTFLQNVRTDLYYMV
jgi:hypothetical protein